MLRKLGPLVTKSPVVNTGHTEPIVQSVRGFLTYKPPDSLVETDEIITDNNPWSPTLFEDQVKVRNAGSIRSYKLPLKYRLSYMPLYEAPAAKYVALMKRITMSVAVLGVYGAKLFYDSPLFESIYSITTLVSTSLPMLWTQWKTRYYVSRVFRLYDKEKLQTLENLVDNERLIMEKLTFLGNRTYNQLLEVQSLRINNNNWLGSWRSWTDKDPVNGRKRGFYIVDNIGGIKMDRIWGIAENNSGIDNGRYLK